MEHTKGKWTAWKDEVKPDKWAVYAGENGDIGIAKMLDDNQKANAHLIAATPDMYEALRNLIYRIERGLALGEKLDIEMARRAIAKAEGREKW